MSETVFDLVVIGAGPGGYVAAIRAAQLGMKVACVEKETSLGGTCLRVGCIPSKALLDTSEKLATAAHHFAELGIHCDNLRLDLSEMMARKNRIVATLGQGIAGLFKKNKIERISGTAAFINQNEIDVTAADGSHQRIGSERFLIATGSVPIELPSLPFDGQWIISSDHAIALANVPQRLVVIGAGAIGLELGSVWHRLGSQVTVLELHHTTLPGADDEMGRQMEKTLRRQGLELIFEAKVTGHGRIDGQLVVNYHAEGKDQILAADVILVAVGRKAYTQGLNLEALGLSLDPRGRIPVNARFETGVPGIYAIGDVIAGPMLAHKAEEEGVAVAEFMTHRVGHVDHNLLPGVVYTSPELAWVGKTEEQLKAEQISYQVGKFRFSANGRALCMGETEGLVKILADATTDRVLGVHIFGPQASSLIAEATAVMAFGGSAEDIARTCHAHPTLPEALKEAALAVDKRAIHS